MNLGLEANVERFRSAKSIFHPHLIGSLMMLTSFVIYPLAGRTSAVLAALLAVLALASELLELSFRSNLLRWLVPKGESQNVFAILPPAGEHRQDLILMGHLDSQLTPIVFKNERWLKVYEIFTTVAFLTFTLQAVLYIVGIFNQGGWIWPSSIIGAASAVLLAAMCVQAETTPFSHGANDNATAAGLVLTLAEELLQQPLEHSRIWLVGSGCEEVQHYGAIDFFKKHRDKMLQPKAVVFEMLGCSGPAWLVKEGIVVPFHASPKLVKLAQELAAHNPDLQAYPAAVSGGNTEMADALIAGVEAITLCGFGPNGSAPYWHQVEDTLDKIDRTSLKQNYEFIWQYLQRIDQAG